MNSFNKAFENMIYCTSIFYSGVRVTVTTPKLESAISDLYWNFLIMTKERGVSNDNTKIKYALSTLKRLQKTKITTRTFWRKKAVHFKNSSKNQWPLVCTFWKFWLKNKVFSAYLISKLKFLASESSLNLESFRPKDLSWNVPMVLFG